MTIFYIDTSSSYLYTGLVKNDKLLVERKTNLSHDLSSFALNEVREMFKEVHLEPKDIDKIIVVNGPGSFTGIRIGITIAKIYAWCLKKAITTITSLEAMAVSSKIDKVSVPVIDARRGYVYASIFDGGKCLLKPKYIRLDQLKKDLDKKHFDYEFISNDSIMGISAKKYNPNILKIVLKYQDKDSINPHLVEPDYLKLTEAEENKLKEV